MTTSKSRNSVGPVIFPKLSAYNVNFIQPRSGKPSGMSSSGSGWISTSGRTPLETSVKQINRKSNDKFLATIPYRRLTYSGPNLSPHFIQMTFTTLVEIFFVLILELYSGGHLPVKDKSLLCIAHLAIEEHILVTVFSTQQHDLYKLRLPLPTLQQRTSTNHKQLLLSRVGNLRFFRLMGQDKDLNCLVNH